MKTVLLAVLFVLTPFYVSAQLRVLSNGNVNIKSVYNYVPAALSVGVNDSSSISTLDIGYLGLYVKSPINSPIPSLNRDFPDSPPFRISMMGSANDVAGSAGYFSCGTIGVMGRAGNNYPGYNYGVFGTLIGSNNGAGVYASTGEILTSIPGKYAGYFKGSTYVNGTLTATNILTPSDIRLKANVESLNTEKSILEKLLKMNVISYNYKTEIEEKETANRHYGLSAQETQNIYPDLVYEGQDGYLGVNYVELVPVLIRAIQELKEEIDNLQYTGSERKSPSKTTTDVSNTTTHKNLLFQNTPNPTKDQTVIRYQLADNTLDAAICIFDLTGKQIKRYPISTGTSSITINGHELGQGMFLYSLIVNGQEIDTKKMVITK